VSARNDFVIDDKDCAYGYTAFLQSQSSFFNGSLYETILHEAA